MNIDKFNFIGVKATNYPGAIEAINHSVKANGTHTSKAFHLINSYSCVLFSTKASDNPLLTSHSVNLPDGYWLSRYMQFKSRKAKYTQVRGPELFNSFLKSADAENMNHAFIGSTLDTLAKLEARVSELNPRIASSLYISPPFRDLDESDLQSLEIQVRENMIDLVWVGMGTPKQDYLAELLTVRTGITTVAVGAAFDFLAGTKPEAPRIMTRLGIEWLYRLATEPRRLWKRYLIGNLVFIGLVIRDLSRK